LYACRQTFAAAGVAPEKLFVVPQGIDAAYFDPEKYEPLVLRELPGTQLVTGGAGESYRSSSSSSSSISGSSSQGTKPYGEWLATLAVAAVSSYVCQRI
jgi:hypothetical protein